MLTVVALRTPDPAYYLAPGRLVEGPLADLDAGRGRWVGTGATGLGLSGPVDRAALAALIEGRQPLTGRPLRSPRGVAVKAYDLCWSAPKSVSVALGLGDDATATAVLAAHRRGVEGALFYLERRALVVRRSSDGERRNFGTTGALAAAFEHGTSRSGDPHLHTHVVVANLAHGLDGRFTTIDARGLFAHAAAAGALYEADLRHTLANRLGARFERRGEGVELLGADPLVLAAFSGRRSEIAAHLARRSGRSHRANRVAWAVTRPPKEQAGSFVERRERWRHLAGIFGPEVHIAPRREPLAPFDEGRFAAALWQEPSLRRRQVVEAWARACLDGVPAPEVDAAVEVWMGHPGGPGVAEAPVAPGTLLVRRGVLDVLGPRPVGFERQEAWRQAAGRLGAYLDRCPPSAPPASLTPRELLAHLEARRRAEKAVAALGRSLEAPGARDLGLSR